MMIQEVAGNAHKNCSVCGTRRASALWMAFDGELLCCEHCGLKHLPQLIADAVVAEQGSDIEHAKALMIERFDRAVEHANARIQAKGS
ncbi:Uncharacterised protein [BD1-7 clade bacterium]|uniref:Uncharacterized protein n=1 Tax=BD1-7 clade bacterium TaxID=2029982 RepID=A0A5S9NNC7_9GAMM|nr:Uncharacterised protein [BD1-7 clade bacterium]